MHEVEGLPPLITSLKTRWKCMVRFTCGPNYRVVFSL